MTASAHLGPPYRFPLSTSAKTAVYLGEKFFSARTRALHPLGEVSRHLTRLGLVQYGKTLKPYCPRMPHSFAFNKLALVYYLNKVTR